MSAHTPESGNAPAESPPSVQTAPTRRRRWRTRIILISSAIAIACFARFAYLRLTLRPTPRPRYWAEQIAALDPAGANKVEYTRSLRWYIEKGDAGIRADLRFDEIPNSLLVGRWSADRPDIVSASKVFERGHFDIAADNFSRLVGHGWFDPARAADDHDLDWAPDWWVECLLSHSRWARERQDHSRAERDWIDLLRLARQARRTRLSRAVDTASQIEGAVAMEMNYAARESLFTDPRRLADEIKEILKPELTPAALLEGHRLVLHCRLEEWYVRESGDWIVVDCVLQSRLRGPTPTRLWNLASWLFADLGEARSTVDRWFALLDKFDNLVALSRVDWTRYNDRVGFGAPAPGPLLGFWGGIDDDWWLHARWQYTLFAHLAARMQIDAALAMMALATFRQRNGHYPRRLEELIPEYLPALPRDHADGRTLRYHLDGDQFVLYSVGCNGVDDGGRWGTGWWTWSDPACLDIVFSNYER